MPTSRKAPQSLASTSHAGGNYVANFHRLFGDFDGDKDVDDADVAAFRAAFGTSSLAFDADVDAADFGRF